MKFRGCIKNRKKCQEFKEVYLLCNKNEIAGLIDYFESIVRTETEYAKSNNSVEQVDDSSDHYHYEFNDNWKHTDPDIIVTVNPNSKS